ncbi:MAG: hypothetical protein AB1564_00660 [Chloroflexota bacterium]
MKRDRFLFGILIGIGVLIVLALVLFFTRQDTLTYVDDSTPEGVVHNYAVAVFKGDYEKAYSYLADKKNKPTFQQFEQDFLYRYVDPSNVGLQVGETEIRGARAVVLLTLSYSNSDPFSSGYSNEDRATLIQQDGKWRLEQMPYNFWSYNWYQPTTEPVY